MSKSFKNALRVAELCAKGTPPFARETIHLCNWYVTLVRPSKELPEDQFQCKVPMVMTKFDIRNYFEKIYNIKVHKVDTRIQHGKMKPKHRGIKREKVKTPDYKVAYVTMADQTFTFPSTFESYLTERRERMEEDHVERQENYEQQQMQKNKWNQAVKEHMGQSSDAVVT